MITCARIHDEVPVGLASEKSSIQFRDPIIKKVDLIQRKADSSLFKSTGN
jgi:hypothetical protein